MDACLQQQGLFICNLYTVRVFAGMFHLRVGSEGRSGVLVLSVVACGDQVVSIQDLIFRRFFNGIIGYVSFHILYFFCFDGLSVGLRGFLAVDDVVAGIPYLLIVLFLDSFLLLLIQTRVLLVYYTRPFFECP